MATLQDYKKQRGYTNKDIGRMLGCSASTAGMILQGRHIRVYHDAQIDKLASILGITFERCWLAMCESYKQWSGSPMEQPRPDEVRAEVQEQLGLPVDEPRSMTIIDGSVVIAESHRLGKSERDG